MPRIKAFQAIRPKAELASKVASLPYDVMNREEAKRDAYNNKYSFLHIIRSEIDLSDQVCDYDERVYEKAKQNLDLFLQSGVLFREEKPCLYLYQISMDLPEGKKVTQCGVVCLVRVDDYEHNVIKKHELTRQAKLEDRIRHFTACNACTESVFLAHKTSERISKLKTAWMQEHLPEYSFQSEDKITHTLWRVDDEKVIGDLMQACGELDAFYIADGHHRSASAAAVCKKRETGVDGGYFLATIFSSEELHIMDYNRVIADLNGHSESEILELLSEQFEIKEHQGAYHPRQKKRFGMYLGGKWYELILKEVSGNSHEEGEPSLLLKELDVSILQDLVISRIFHITDVTKDERIDFVGGIRGLEVLEKRVAQDMKIAFSLCPTSIEEVFEIADHHLIMPPKSTWFEPKLRSGLFLYTFSDL